MGGQVCTGEMHGGVAAFQRPDIVYRIATIGMPFHFEDVVLGGRPRRSPDKSHHLDAITQQSLGERLANQAGSAGEE
jgi:hypothetical protein